jgi:protein TonB
MNRKQRLLRRLPILASSLAGAALLAAFVWVVHGIIAGKGARPERKVQIVQVIRPPPPPPPEEKPPPPPRPEEAAPTEEPEPTPSDAEAPAERLGLDSEGTAGGDAFGLAAHKGGHDIAGSGGAIFAWYTTRLKDHVASQLSDDARVRSKRFSVAVRLWVDPDGAIRQVRLAGTTGNRDLDTAIEAVLGRLPRMSEPPPAEMPQPINLRIVSRS